MLYLYHVNSLTYYELVNEINIGRTSGEIICADDGRMSGKHAQVTIESPDIEPRVFVQDLGSKNHTAVNRTEISPNEKIRLKMYSLIETGDQKFVITDSNNVNIQNLNEMIDKHLKRSLIALEEVPAELPNPLMVEASPYQIMQTKEASIVEIQNDIVLLEQTAKKELMRLEEAKDELITKAKARKIELTKQMNSLKIEVEEAKTEMAKIKAELELKKKKIINLKDIPVESTEEFPE